MTSIECWLKEKFDSDLGQSTFCTHWRHKEWCTQKCSTKLAWSVSVTNDILFIDI